MTSRAASAFLAAALLAAPALAQTPPAPGETPSPSPGGLQMPNPGAPGGPPETRRGADLTAQDFTDAVEKKASDARSRLYRKDLDGVAAEIRAAVDLLEVRQAAVVDPAKQDIETSVIRLRRLAKAAAAGDAPAESDLNEAFGRATTALRMSVERTP